ncbi:hypothetical protein V5F77_04420 [Xanthobacter sp. DSM 24535]|uniref:hypothetical protein n=1 Tax=Roseixanthobacter psychrophilus TaxID=3119917 RepID=UPI0037286306
MAGMGMGIGSFMDGFSGGVRIRQGMDDRAYQRQKDAQDREDFLFARQRQVQRQDEARKLNLEDRQFVGEQRDRQRKEWGKSALVDDAYKASADEADAARRTDLAAAVQPIEAQGPTLDGKGLPAWKVGEKTFTDETQAKQQADGTVKPFMDYFVQKGVPRIQESYIRAGQPEKAKAFGEWIENDKVKRGMESWARAARAASHGDVDAFAKHMTDAYNSDDYFDDLTKIEGSKKLTDKDGNVTGFELTFKNQKTGEASTQTFSGMEDIYRFGLNFLSPENTFKYGAKYIEDADKQRAEIAKEKRAQRYKLETDTNKALLGQAVEAAKHQGPQAYDALVKRLNAAMGTLGANDLAYARLPDDEKAARAMAYLREQDKAAQAGLQGTSQNSPQISAPMAGALQASPPAGRSIPMWMPNQ